MPEFSFFKKPIVQIQIAVFLWGFTAILGKLISLDAIMLVFLRMLIASGVYLLYPRTYAQLRLLSRKQVFSLFIIGVLICFHWLCFYHSIKVFDSSTLALICLGTGPMFVLWIEYIFLGNREISTINIVVSVVALIGMILLAFGRADSTSHRSGDLYLWAIMFGLAASFLAALFTVLNKRLISDIHPLALSTIELLSGAVVLLIYLTISHQLVNLYSIVEMDWVYIVLLAVVCTNIPFLLSILALNKLSSFTITLSVNLEPIYGLVIASVLFGEYHYFNTWFFIGAFLILISVFLPLIKQK